MKFRKPLQCMSEPFLFTELICKNEGLVFLGSVHNSLFQKLASKEVSGAKGMRSFQETGRQRKGVSTI